MIFLLPCERVFRAGSEPDPIRHRRSGSRRRTTDHALHCPGLCHHRSAIGRIREDRFFELNIELRPDRTGVAPRRHERQGPTAPQGGASSRTPEGRSKWETKWIRPEPRGQTYRPRETERRQNRRRESLRERSHACARAPAMIAHGPTFGCRRSVIQRRSSPTRPENAGANAVKFAARPKINLPLRRFPAARPSSSQTPRATRMFSIAALTTSVWPRRAFWTPASSQDRTTCGMSANRITA